METTLRNHPPAVAKVLLWAKGIPITEAARELRCSPSWAYQVLGGKAPAPARFRRDLAALLGVPERELFPGYAEGVESDAD